MLATVLNMMNQGSFKQFVSRYELLSTLSLIVFLKKISGPIFISVKRTSQRNAMQEEKKLPALQLLLNTKVQWRSTYVMLHCAEDQQEVINFKTSKDLSFINLLQIVDNFIYQMDNKKRILRSAGKCKIFSSLKKSGNMLEPFVTSYQYCYDFRRLRQSSIVVVSKVRSQMSLEECKSWTCIVLLGLRAKVQVEGLSIKDQLKNSLQDCPLYIPPVWQRYEYGYAMSQYYGSAMSQQCGSDREVSQSSSAMTHF